MLKPKNIHQVLKQSVTGGIKATLLLNSEGSPLAFVADSDREARVYAAIASNVWSTVERAGGSIMREGGSGDASEDNGSVDEKLRFMFVECEEGTISITTVSGTLLCLVARPEVGLGILKAKTDALVRHLEEPFQQIAAYT